MTRESSAVFPHCQVELQLVNFNNFEEFTISPKLLELVWWCDGPWPLNFRRNGVKFALGFVGGKLDLDFCSECPSRFLGTRREATLGKDEG